MLSVATSGHENGSRTFIRDPDVQCSGVPLRLNLRRRAPTRFLTRTARRLGSTPVSKRPFPRVKISAHHPTTSPDDNRDEALIVRLRHDDESAFRAIWESYHARLTSFATRQVRAPDVAADVVQQVFVALWDGRRTLAPRSTLAAWLFRAAHLRTLLVLRAERDARRREVDWADADDFGIATSANDAADRAEVRERIEHVRALLGRMPPRVREIFLLSRREGLKPNEIAVMLGIKPQVVYNQLSTALRLLAEGLTDR